MAPLDFGNKHHQKIENGSIGILKFPNRSHIFWRRPCAHFWSHKKPKSCFLGRVFTRVGPNISFSQFKLRYHFWNSNHYYDFFLIVTPNRPFTASLFFSKHNGAVSLAPSFIFALCPFYIVVTYRMSATTHFDHWFHRCHFALTYYIIFFSSQQIFITVAVINCCIFRFLSFSLTWWLQTVILLPIPSEVRFINILRFYFPGAMLLYHLRHGLLLFLLYFIVVTFRMSMTKYFDRLFHR